MRHKRLPLLSVLLLLSTALLAACAGDCRTTLKARLAENRLLVAESGRSAHRIYPNAVAYANMPCVFTAISTAVKAEKAAIFTGCSTAMNGRSLARQLALYDLATAYTDWLSARAGTGRFACLSGTTDGLAEKRLVLQQAQLAYLAFGCEKFTFDFEKVETNPCNSSNALFDPYSRMSRQLIHDMITVMLKHNSETQLSGASAFNNYLDHLGNSGPPDGDFKLMQRSHTERVVSEIAKRQNIEAAFPVIEANLRHVADNSKNIPAACKGDVQ